MRDKIKDKNRGEEGTTLVTDFVQKLESIGVCKKKNTKIFRLDYSLRLIHI